MSRPLKLLVRGVVVSLTREERYVVREALYTALRLELKVSKIDGALNRLRRQARENAGLLHRVIRLMAGDLESAAETAITDTAEVPDSKGATE